MLVLLAGHLLLRGKDRLDGAEIDVNHAGVGPLLDDTRNDVALAALELAEHVLVGDVAQPLVDDLLRGERRDAAEVAGAVDCLAHDKALVVVLGDEDRNVAGLAVQVHPGRDGALTGLGRIRVLEVGSQNRLLDDGNQFLERNFALALKEPQHAQIDVH